MIIMLYIIIIPENSIIYLIESIFREYEKNYCARTHT